MRFHLHPVNRSVKEGMAAAKSRSARKKRCIRRDYPEAVYRVEVSGLVVTDGSDYERFDPCALRAGCNGHVSSLASDEQVHDEVMCKRLSAALAAKAAVSWDRSGDYIR